jgi:outer membrane protein
VFVLNLAFSQDTITLQHCLDLTKNNTLLVTPYTSGIDKANLNLHFHTWTLLPSLNASTGFNTSLGRRVDPFTNTFTTNTVNSQSFGLNTSIPVFNGFNYIFTKNKFSIEKQKSELSLVQQQNELSRQTIELYVELCKLQIQKDLGNGRIEKYKQLQTLQRLLIKGGKINAIDTLRSYNSLLNEKGELLSIENQITQKTIDLNYLIGLPLMSTHLFQVSSIEQITDKILFKEDFEKINVGFDIQVAEEQKGVDRSKILPSLNLSGSIGTGYSTNNKDYSVSGNPVFPYDQQINKNLYEGFGMNLSIPIFNKGNYLKAKQLSDITIIELQEKEKLIELDLEKRKVQQEQQLLFLNAQLLQQTEMSKNLQVIYDKMFLQYKEGKISYKDVETAFLDWQMRLVEVNVTSLSMSLIRLEMPN